MKKLIPVWLLVLGLVLTTPALAAENNMSHFSRSKTYESQFSDVTTDSVFYGNIAALYEYGLSIGKLDGTFGVQDEVTVGQILIFAGRIHSLYHNGDPESGAAVYTEENLPVSVPYLRYLQAEGILGNELNESLELPATRAQVAHVLANLLPEEALPRVHSEKVSLAIANGRYFPDLNNETPYIRDILALFYTGISLGSDAVGSFFPDAPISRGAVAAMLTRMVDPALRVTPDWTRPTDDFVSAEGTTLESLVPEAEYIVDPQNAEELTQAIHYMLSSGNNSITFIYDHLSSSKAEKTMIDALNIVKSFCEQGYNAVSCSHNKTGYLNLEFQAHNETYPTDFYREESLAAAIAVHDELWATGMIRPDMTQLEKARVYYSWICENCHYDSESKDPVSHLAYGLFKHGLAVCDGYTGAYNLLLKLEGISCYGLFTDSHIWTVAVLDGEEVHIDTTWGDTDDTLNFLFFAMTPEFSASIHG